MERTPSHGWPASRITLADSVFARMTALAARHGAANLGQGFPDDDGPAGMLDRAARAVRDGGAAANQYGPPRGVPALRRAVAEDRRRRYGLELDPDAEVLVTVGATEGIAAALLAFVEPGREVVVLEPTYDAYDAAVRVAGGVPRPVPLRFDGTRWSLDREAFAAAVGPRTAAVVVNTPHNPTGLVLGPDDLGAVADVVRPRGVPVIADEVYERLVLDGAHTPFASLPGMAAQTVTLGSAGKSFNVTGWKTGWATGPAEMIDAVAAAKQYLTFVGATPLQPAVAWALDHAGDWGEGWVSTLRSRRDSLVATLRSTGMTVAESAGTYFVVSDVAPVLAARPELGRTAEEFCLRLPEVAGVAAIPVSAFMSDPDDPVTRTLVRWTFCKSAETMATAQARLAAAFGGSYDGGHD
ncbi:aminotransferase class I/II-fold pyridoxal phosphate-dependent enzyme [Corynebacterium bovis]|uniref:aminotransferase class I/II-fold pyridoxal phosphate-dependent enzyme n=1 Tax=Corynebacterium bovis TaxID=36808 RepID=UPI0031392DDB